MKYVGHSPTVHVLLDYVAAGGKFPLPDPLNRNLARTLLARLIRYGVVDGLPESGAPLALTEGGMALLAKWAAPGFRGRYCHCPH